MALTDKQKQELDIASQRVASGAGSDTDKANIAYATKNLGYSFQVAQEEDTINTQQTSSTREQSDNEPSAVSGIVDTLLTKDTTSAEKEGARLAERFESERQTRLAEEQKKADAAELSLEELTTGEGLEQKQRDLMEEFEINETRKLLEELDSQMVALQEQYKMEDLAIQNKPILGSIIRGQQAIKQQEYAAKASTLEAKSAIAGQKYNMASDIVKNLYSAATTDRQNSIRYHEKLLSMADRNVITLTREEKENVGLALDALSSQDARAEEDKNSILRLLNDPSWSSAFAKSGADLSMSFEDISEAVSPYLAQQYEAEQAKGSGGLTASQLRQILKDQGKAAITLTEEALDSDSTFISLLNVAEDSGSLTAALEYAVNSGATKDAFLSALELSSNITFEDGEIFADEGWWGFKNKIGTVGEVDAAFGGGITEEDLEGAEEIK